MTKLFEKTEIKGVKLKNRTVRSATWMGLAQKDGQISPELIEKMNELSKGSIGLIITGHAYISKEGIGGSRQIAIDEDKYVEGLAKLTSKIHERDTPIFIQLSHAGNFASDRLTEHTPFAVSIYDGLHKEKRRQFSQEDIEILIKKFVDGARRAKVAQFDGIELHMAHGYLLSQFLSPLFNRRDDEYGGSVDKRSSVPIKIVKAIREEVGNEYPIMVKLNCQDFAEGGLSVEDSIFTAQKLQSAGVDIMEISGGLLSTPETGPCRRAINSPVKESYFAEEAKKFKETLSIPIVLTGGIRSFEKAQSVLADKFTDYIGLSRPLISEPNLVKRWFLGDRKKSKCISCNKCFVSGIKGKGVSCILK